MLNNEYLIASLMILVELFDDTIKVNEAKYVLEIFLHQLLMLDLVFNVIDEVFRHSLKKILWAAFVIVSNQLGTYGSVPNHLLVHAFIIHLVIFIAILILITDIVDIVTQSINNLLLCIKQLGIVDNFIFIRDELSVYIWDMVLVVAFLSELLTADPTNIRLDVEMDEHMVLRIWHLRKKLMAELTSEFIVEFVLLSYLILRSFILGCWFLPSLNCK